MIDYVAYYRVSTNKQGYSSLGLDAQRRAINNFVGVHGQIVAEFTEIKSGQKDERVELNAAIACCQKLRARLIVAKLDRLARNVHFISGLIESNIEFTACDMPHADRFTLHVTAAFAEREREMISKRTKEALAAAKTRGTKLGNPRPVAPSPHVRDLARAKDAAHRVEVAPMIREMEARGMSRSAIARELTARHVPTARGGRWDATRVRNVLVGIA